MAGLVLAIFVEAMELYQRALLADPRFFCPMRPQSDFL
jgi:hypothetical protein